MMGNAEVLDQHDPVSECPKDQRKILKLTVGKREREEYQEKSALKNV